MRNLAEYFALADWPMPNSPLGRAVQVTAEKRPEFTPEQCLEYARQALYDAAGRKHYQVIILSAEQEKRREESRQRMRAKWDKRRGERAQRVSTDAEAHPETPVTTIPEAGKVNP